MKNFFTTIICIASISLVSADTAFRWANSSGGAYDDNNTLFSSGGATVFSFLDFDLTLAPSFQPHATIIGAFQVHIDDILLSAIVDFQNITIAPFGSPPVWGVQNDIIQAGNSRAGSLAYAIVAKGGGLSTISVGDIIGQATNSYLISALGSPPGATQQFNGGMVETNVIVIPEPGTIALMLIAGAATLIGVRRKNRA